MSNKFQKGQKTIPAEWLNGADDTIHALRSLSPDGGILSEQTQAGLAISLDFDLIRQKIATIPGGGIFCRLTGVGEKDGTYQSWEELGYDQDKAGELKHHSGMLEGDANHILVERNGIWPLQYTDQSVDSDPANPDTTTIVHCDEFYINNADEENITVYYYFDAPDTHVTDVGIDLHEAFSESPEPDDWDSTHATTRQALRLYFWRTWFGANGAPQRTITMKEFRYYVLISPNKGVIYVSDGALMETISWMEGTPSP